jgi:diguanylate cyclase (GGDEF)-like protein
MIFCFFVLLAGITSLICVTSGISDGYIRRFLWGQGFYWLGSLGAALLVLQIYYLETTEQLGWLAIVGHIGTEAISLCLSIFAIRYQKQLELVRSKAAADQEELSAAKEIVNNLPEGVAIAILRCKENDRGGVSLTYITDYPLWRQLFGIEESIAGKDHYDVFASLEETMPEWVEQHQQLARQGKSFQVKDAVEFPNSNTGETCWLQYAIGPSERRNPATGLYSAIFVAKDVTSLVLAKMEGEWQASHDPLTGLGSRYLLSKVEASDYNSALLVDLDSFKLVNDTAGHVVGDEILAATASRIKELITPDDLAIRIGGDEFLVLTPSKPTEAIELGWRLHEAISRPIITELGGRHTIGATCGIAEILGGGIEAAQVQADIALYYRKHNRSLPAVLPYQPSMGQKLEASTRLLSRLGDALTDNSLELWYQPIFDITGEVIRLSGFEALTRWRDGDGFIPPSEFIPIAEKYGKIRELTEWVIAEVERQLAEWQDKFPGMDLKISINLSGENLRDPSLIDFIQALIERRKVNPERLIFEITESALGGPEVNAVIQSIENLGPDTSLDDFPTGFNGLLSLMDLPVSMLKIDRALVSGDAELPLTTPMVELIVRMAGVKKLEVVAEGVETNEQLVRVRDAGCHYAQGFYLGKPLSAADAEAFACEHLRRGEGGSQA